MERIMEYSIASQVEKYLWNNWKFYLQTYATCFLDTLLEVVSPESESPFERYRDFSNELEKHMGLGSYVNAQAAQFSNIPYVTVNIQAVPMGNCHTRVIMGFDIVFSTDTPKAPNESTFYAGSSSESVAEFRSNIIEGINRLMYHAFGKEEIDPWRQQSFFDVLRNQTVTNPLDNSQTKEWAFNIRGQVNDSITITEVEQLKREDRSVGLNVFHVIYNIEIYKLWDGENTFGC